MTPEGWAAIGGIITATAGAIAVVVRAVRRPRVSRPALKSPLPPPRAAYVDEHEFHAWTYRVTAAEDRQRRLEEQLERMDERQDRLDREVIREQGNFNTRLAEIAGDIKGLVDGGARSRRR